MEPKQEAALNCVSLMEELNLVSSLNIDREKLTRFITEILQNYEDVPYHNYQHAVRFFKFGHECIKANRNLTAIKLTRLAELGFLIAGLCHDVSHGGLTNSFHLKYRTPLCHEATSPAVMEEKHLRITLYILESESCNFLHRLDEEDTRTVIKVIQNCILSTEFGGYVNRLSKYKKDSDAAVAELLDEENKFLAFLMNCCDLSDHSREWKIARQTGLNVYREFFDEGDLERRLGGVPLGQNKRENQKNIPGMQEGFLKSFVLPTFKIFSKIFQSELGKTAHLGAQKNLDKWQSEF